MHSPQGSIGELKITSIDVVQYDPGHPPRKRRIDSQKDIADIQRAVRQAKATSCHMESYASPKYFLSLNTAKAKGVAKLEVQTHVVVIGEEAVVETPNREVWTLVEHGLRQRQRMTAPAVLKRK